VTGENSLYQVKSVLMQQLPKGYKVAYLNPHWYTVSAGSGCNDTFVSDDGTWSLEVVLRSSSSQRLSIDPEGWVAYVQQKLAGTRGTPTAYVGGLVDLVKGGCSAPLYDQALGFWAGVQPYYEIASVPSEINPSEHKAKLTQINKTAPGLGWQYAPKFMGHKGLGIATGNALEPSQIQPLALAATSSGGAASVPGGPAATLDPSSPWYLGPPLTTAGPMSWRTVPTTGKIVAISAGALAAWAAGRLLLG